VRFSSRALFGAIMVSIALIAMSGAAFAQGSTKLGSIKIFWIGKTLNNPWWIMSKDMAVREANALGVKIVTELPQQEVDLQTQISMIDSAIEQHASAIVISAASSQGVIPALKQAQAQGIPIINFDTEISDPTIAKTYVAADDYEGAFRACTYLAQQLDGKGDVGLLEGLQTQSTGVNRKNGCLDAWKKFPGITVAAIAPAQWRTDLATTATIDMLTAHPNIKGIFASNDQMTIGMVAGAATEGRSAKNMVLVGYDGIMDAVALIKEGKLTADMALPTRWEGETGIRMAVYVLLHPDATLPQKIFYPDQLVTATPVAGANHQTADEYLARNFPLMGASKTGY